MLPRVTKALAELVKPIAKRRSRAQSKPPESPVPEHKHEVPQEPEAQPEKRVYSPPAEDEQSLAHSYVRIVGGLRTDMEELRKSGANPAYEKSMKNKKGKMKKGSVLDDEAV